MSDNYFHYTPSKPYPIQADEYIRQQGTIIESAMKLLKAREQSNSDVNEYHFLCAYYMNELEKHYKMNNDLYILTRTFALDTQIDYNWCKYRQIYKFDTEFFSFLTEETSSENVVSDIFLHRLPFPCFFVENKIVICGTEYAGFYVLKRKSPEGGLELFLQFCQTDEERNFLYVAIPLREGETKTVSELLKERYNYIPTIPDQPHKREEFVEMGNKAISVLAYLCTEKPDIIKIRSGAQSSGNKGKAAKKKDVINIGQVGYKLARTIRESRVRYVYEGEISHNGRGKGTPKSAHMRKAHYHSFWTGKRDDPEGRKLTVRLMSPIFVNGGLNNRPTTVRKVSDPNKRKGKETEQQ